MVVKRRWAGRLPESYTTADTHFAMSINLAPVEPHLGSAGRYPTTLQEPRICRKPKRGPRTLSCPIAAGLRPSPYDPGILLR